MNYSEIRQRIDQSLSEVRTIDPHCHLDRNNPGASDLTQIILYHHIWIELISSGMDQYAVSTTGQPHETDRPGMEPMDRIMAALPYLKNIKTTTLGLFLKWILTDLYEVEPEITKDNVQKLYDLVKEKGQDSAWQEHILRDRCNIEWNITVKGGRRRWSPLMIKKYGPPPEWDPTCTDGVNLAAEWAPCNIIYGKTTPAGMIRKYEKTTEMNIENADDYRAMINHDFKAFDWDDLNYLGLWIVPYVTPELATDEEITRIIQKAKSGKELSRPEIGSVCFWGMRIMLEKMRETNLRTIQLFVGSEVQNPHRAIVQWGEDFSGTVARIAGEFEDFHFNASTASDVYTQDLGNLAKHTPNISVAGYWWHVLYPRYIKKSIETRIDMIPSNKIIAFFSDAYHAEWVYPKLRMVKQIWGDVLSERVDKGWMELDTALELIEKVFYENAKSIYHLT